MFRQLEIAEFLDLLFHLDLCEARDRGTGIFAIHFGEEEPLGETACACGGYLFGTFSNKEERGVVNVCGDVGIAGDELGQFVSYAEEAVVICCDT